ncbi:hypothetical protein DTL42_25505 [Bremerella cremea]|uniref:Uncharacterized protein n=1 Tax=Bremerella cremea TaxID=1031537 RepID=A0A368KJI7_9BACT|nr:hypothetical protein [Bremerella cremea]RCS40722.1 hypothetical protein DTL42_25505 [Bremerella cremea]
MTIDHYPTEIAELLQTAQTCPLGPGSPVPEAYEKLKSLNVNSLSQRALQDRAMAEACLSGLWLRFNYLDQSHTISQDLPDSTGSYWHGIMHRREPDYSNAKYWFRRTGNHPAMVTLANKVNFLVANEKLDRKTQFLSEVNWDPMAMVDACEAVARGNCQQQELLEKVAQTEWETLFEYCYSRAY